MLALSGVPATLSGARDWNILFAREPEPDLDFDDMLEEEEEGPSRGSASRTPPKRSGGRPLLWVLLLVLVAGGAYVAMDPEILMDALSPLLEERSTSPNVATPPPKAGTPEPAAPAPAHLPATAEQPPAPPAPAPTQPLPGEGGAPTPKATAPAMASPLFREGQEVTVIEGLGGSVALTPDAAGTRPGPFVRPGSSLTVLDGELQSTGWVYIVKTAEGNIGWIPEKYLRLKP